MYLNLYRDCNNAMTAMVVISFCTLTYTGIIPDLPSPEQPFLPSQGNYNRNMKKAREVLCYVG